MSKAAKCFQGGGFGSPPLAAVAVLAALALAIAPGRAEGVSVITNGSFESGYNPPTGTFRTLQAGTADADDIDGWLVTANSVDWICTYWQAAHGVRSLDMSGTAAGTIVTATIFSTIPGEPYLVEFYMSGNPDGTRGVKTLKVIAQTGSSTYEQTFTYDTLAKGNTRTDMKWELQSWYFTAQGATTTLGFASLTSTAYGPALDNVSVELVPEPLTLAGVLLGVGCAAGYVRRRRG